MAQQRRFYLKEWRTFRGLTQQQLADRAGMTKGYLSNVERGERRYNEEILAALAEALSIEPWELIGRNPEITPEPVVHLWDRILEPDRPAARRMLESLAEKDAKKAG